MATMKPASKQFVIVSSVVLFVIPTILALASFNDLFGLACAWYWHEVRGPEIRQEMGFDAELARIGDSASGFDVFVLTSVSADGPLGRLGLKAGDVPTAGYRH